MWKIGHAKNLGLQSHFVNLLDLDWYCENQLPWLCSLHPSDDFEKKGFDSLTPSHFFHTYSWLLKLANTKNVHFTITNYHEAELHCFALEMDEHGVKWKAMESFVILPLFYFDIVTCYVVEVKRSRTSGKRREWISRLVGLFSSQLGIQVDHGNWHWLPTSSPC